jgi:DNA-binding XRE family transcriptional regulator
MRQRCEIRAKRVGRFRPTSNVLRHMRSAVTLNDRGRMPSSERRHGNDETASTDSVGEMLMAFGQRLRLLRAAQGWTSERLARESSLTIRTVLRVEKGEQEPLLSTVMLLSSALDLTPADLLLGLPVPLMKRSWPRNERSDGGIAATPAEQRS